MRYLAALLLALPLFAQTVQFGNSVPVTDTRYGSFAANAVLTTNGHDFYAAWGARENVRFGRVVENERRVARPVFEGRDVRDVDLAWTGTYFVVLGQAGNDILGRVLDAKGDPVSGVFTLREDAHTARFAWDGTNLMVLYQVQTATAWEAYTLRLRPAVLPVELANPAFITSAPAKMDLGIASNGSGFAAVTTTSGETKITMLNSGGSIVRQVVGPGGGEAAIASNGSDYLAVSTFEHFLDTTIVRANGTIEPPVAYPVTGDSVRATDVAWDRNAYVISFLSKSGSQTQARVVRLDPYAKTSDEDEDAYPALETGETSIAAVNGQVLTAWQWDDDHTASMRPVTEGEDDPDALAYGAAEQTLGAAVASSTGLLTIWSELADGVLGHYTGVRKHDGRWTEQRVPSMTTLPAFAATDGNEFIAVTNESSSFTIFNLDAEGKLEGAWVAPVNAGRVHDVLWTGESYVIAYASASGTASLGRLDRSGVLTQSVTVAVTPHTIHSMSLASDGSTVLLVWQLSDGNGEFVEASRFSTSLQRLDLTPLALAGDDSFQPRAIYDGTSFLVVWQRPAEVIGAILPRTTGMPSTVFTIGRPQIEEMDTLRVARLANGVAVYWQKNDREAFLVRNTTATAFESSFDDRLLVTLPDGSGTFVGTEVNLDAPHHGARRIFRRGIDIVPFTGIPNPPPSVTIRRFTNSQFRIEWTAPAQPVDGYRVEYKVGDGQWLELGRWFDPDERLASWPTVRPGESYQFRVRAFSEAGTSSYTTAGLYTGKRRAVN
ncbi:MAG TPA: fibronectin type III domain-containing protein [Thermoanaerobaculia bacterium]|nr:fibronectin type III domain-containing protein [Thermoanaerobaculia bacterium]